jgi:imidazolonepropionase-like amidohydrolase
VQRLCLPILLARTLFILLAALCLVHATLAQTATPTAILFQNVRIFNGTDKLSAPTNVLVVGNQINKVSSGAIAPPEGARLMTMDCSGRTLMPGLIDAHVHMMFGSLPQVAIMTSDIGFVNLVAGNAATGMLMRG